MAIYKKLHKRTGVEFYYIRFEKQDGRPGLAAGCCCNLFDGSIVGDWRLPNIKELQSLLDYGQKNPSIPAVHPFLGVQSNNYWSSTTRASSPISAWYADLSVGIVVSTGKTINSFVWPVRAGP